MRRDLFLRSQARASDRRYAGAVWAQATAPLLRGALLSCARLRLRRRRYAPLNLTFLRCALRRQAQARLALLRLALLHHVRLNLARLIRIRQRNALREPGRPAPHLDAPSPPSRRNTRPARCACPSA
ncbi:MAG: hypothetical protein ABL900_09030 [Burkholderiaceae bacterium]